MDEKNLNDLETGDKKSFAEQIWDDLEKSKGRNSLNSEVKKAQLQIVHNLPNNFDLEIKGFGNYIEKIQKEPEILERQIAGEIFEWLVRGDKNICPEPETEVGKTVRSVMKSYGFYGLEEDGIDESVMVPDMAFVNESGQLVGAVEVKSGKIGIRGSEQIGNFKETITKVVESLKRVKKEKLESHGLGVIDQNRDKLVVSKDFQVTLAVPFKSYNDDIEELIDDIEIDNPDDLELTEERLNACKIVESPFTREDLGVITTFVTNWYREQKLLEEKIPA